jgi:hypothetical protein
MNPDVINWLLQDDNPMVKYNTLTKVLGYSVNNFEVKESLKKMMDSPPITNILRQQNDDGGFLKEAHARRHGKWGDFGYLPKYKATIWQAHFLAQANVSGDDPHIKRLGNYLLETTYDKKTEKFGIDVMACLNSYLIYALVTFGFSEFKEIKNGFDFQVQYQRFDDGEWDPAKEWPYNGKRGHCWGPLSCYVGITQFVRMLTIVPELFMTKKAVVAKNRAVKFLVDHGIIRRKWQVLFSKSLPCYTKHRTDPILDFWAPMTYLLDPIEVTSNLLELGFDPSDIEEAIEFILSKKTKNNTWVVDKVPSSMYGSWGKEGKESKWVTFRVLNMLKLAGKLDV